MSNRLWMLGAVLLIAACSDKNSQMSALPVEMTGQEIYTHWCADCHEPGPGHPGTLRMAGDFGPENSVMRDFAGLDQDLVKDAVRNGFQMMPPFRATEISDEELDRLAEFLVKK